MRLNRIVAVLAALMILASAANSAIIDVPSAQPTIQAGIDIATVGDTVLVAAGTHSGEGFRDLDFNGKAITVMSESGREATILDCQGDSAEPHRGFIFHSGEDATSVVDGFTIVGGYGSNVVVGMWLNGPAGGAILCMESSPRIQSCAFTDNEAANGGAICCALLASPGIASCSFLNNRGTSIRCVESSSPVVDSCSMVGGTGSISGMFNCSPVVRNCEIRDNQGGISFVLMGSPRFESCLIANNGSGSESSSAFFFADQCNPVLTNCTIVGHKGRGIFCTCWSHPTLHRCIIAYSREGAAATCYLEDQCFSDDSYVELSCCNLYGNAGGDYAGCIEGQDLLDGNFSADPHFCDTSASDFHLDIISPCAPDGNSCASLIGALDVACACCDSVGDIDHDGQGPDIADLIFLVSYMFQEGPTPECFGNANADGNGFEPDIADLIYLVTFMFQEGPPLVPCA